MKKLIAMLAISTSLLFGCNSTLTLEDTSEADVEDAMTTLGKYELDYLPNGLIVDISANQASNKVYFKLKDKDTIDYVFDSDDARFIYIDSGSSYLEVSENDANEDYYTFYINLNQ